MNEQMMEILLEVLDYLMYATPNAVLLSYTWYSSIGSSALASTRSPPITKDFHPNPRCTNQIVRGVDYI